LAGNVPGGWGFRFVQIKGLNKENFDKSSEIFSCTTGRNALIFGMEYPWGKEIQVCSDKVSGIAKTFKQFWR